MKARAFLTLLSKKYRDGEVIFVDTLAMKAPKTSLALEALGALSKAKGFETLSTKRKNAAFVALSKKDANIEKSFRNVGSVVVDEVRNVNVLDLLKHRYIVIENPVESVKVIESKLN
jgi:large subunit ribosomal protein L4